MPAAPHSEADGRAEALVALVGELGEAPQGRSPLLTALDEDDARALAALGRLRTYPRGTTVFHQGDDSTAVVAVLDGVLKVAALSDEGREVIFGLAGRGELLGEISAIDGLGRSATVTALETATAVVVPGARFVEFVEERPRLAMVLVRLVARRLRLADRQRVELATYDVLGRLARRIVEMADDIGTAGDGDVEIALGLTQDDLAAWAGASREATSRALTLMRSLGWLRTERRRLVLLDVDAMRRHTH